MNAFERLAFEEAVKRAKESEDLLIEMYRMAATSLKNYYNALLEKGFTSEQALEIVIRHGINYPEGGRHVVLISK